MGFRETVFAAILSLAAPAMASGPIFRDYQPDNIADALADGDRVVVLVHSFWCQACQRQRAIIEEKRRAHPELDRMTYIVVNWEEYRGMPVTEIYNFEEEATMFVLKDGGEEVNRMTRVTYEDAIEGFLRVGLEW